MNTQDHMELLNRVLDGQATPDELDAFETACVEVPALRQELAELNQVGEAVAGMTAINPPAEMGHRIMRAIRQKEAGRTVAIPSQTTSLRDLLARIYGALFPRPQFAVAYAAVAGLVVGIASYDLVIQESAPQTDAVFGSIGAAGAVPLDEQVIVYSDLEATASVFSVDGAWLVEIDVAASGPVDVEMTLPRGATGWIRLESGAAGAFLQDFAIEGRRMNLRGLENGRYRAVAGAGTAANAEIVLSFWRDGIALKHIQLATGQ
jgi:hypothetical protein